MTIRDRYIPYDRLEIGICVIRYAPDSEIIFCNQDFASLLSTQPEQIEGRSLDDLTTSTALHYEALRPFLAKRSRLVSILGGFLIQIRDQSQPKAKRMLKVARVESDRFDGQIYLIGYVRPATWLELWLNKLRLDASVDPFLKPIGTFFLSGRWRPVAVATAPLWMPMLMNHWPELQLLIETALRP